MKNREISVINIQYEISMLADMEICECILHIGTSKEKEKGNKNSWKHLLLGSLQFLMWDRERKRKGNKKQGASYPEHQSLCLNVQALISSASLTNPTYDCVCWGALWQTLQRRGSFKL